MKVPQIRILNLHWGPPLTTKVYKEIGIVMTEILPYVYKVEFAQFFNMLFLLFAD